ncbi:unnamed protein product [Echinostoma caproni]|uniref:Cyclin N-terminal domain-containing protein n=1 Tax=Echinostoma caproni TaxID=27848 RepID=A0A183B0B0_9TREM|nr:unnamed protein product [Echinostoma caproni]
MLEKKDIVFAEARKLCEQRDDLCAATNADTPMFLKYSVQAEHKRRLPPTAVFHVVNTIYVRLVDSVMPLAMHAPRLLCAFLGLLAISCSYLAKRCCAFNLNPACQAQSDSWYQPTVRLFWVFEQFGYYKDPSHYTPTTI